MIEEYYIIPCCMKRVVTLPYYRVVFAEGYWCRCGNARQPLTRQPLVTIRIHSDD